ncbi:Protein F36D4.4 [Aphelenchoides avenae]|nr:Protein F36D4.4 [Aphelenchus avenae]
MALSPHAIAQQMLMIFVLCYLCLFTVLICYGTILRTIRQFHSAEEKGHFHSEESQRINQRSLHQQRSVDTMREGGMPGTGSAVDKNEPRCNSHRKWRTHLMSRHKYLIVIGSVLFVDILFLFPYSGIQMVAFLHLNNLLGTSQLSTLVRWALQILIGVHSVCQPLCYFRMNEFRRLACCAKPVNRSKSFSQTKDQIGSNEEITGLRMSRESFKKSAAGSEPLLRKLNGNSTYQKVSAASDYATRRVLLRRSPAYEEPASTDGSDDDDISSGAIGVESAQ